MTLACSSRLSWSAALFTLVASGCPFVPPATPTDTDDGTTGATTGATTSGGVTPSPAGSGSAGSGSAGEDTRADSSSGGVPECGNGVVEGDEECDSGGESKDCDADCTAAECGDGTVNSMAGETCDERGESPMCDDDCTAVTCGDSVVNTAAGEECDDGGFSAGCDDDCTNAVCGDGLVNPNAGELCDEGPDSPTCDSDCTAAECGDGVVNMAAGEACDEMVMTETCDVDCTEPVCGDGLINMLANEECDGMGETPACNSDCTSSECGDMVLNMSAGEECDDGAPSATCDLDCTVAICGDATINLLAGEQCDDGNMIPDDGCTDCMVDGGGGVCQNSLTLSTSPSGTMVVCDDPTDTTCEEDFEALCPPGWGLCSRLQHINRNTGWTFATGNMVGGPDVVVGEIHCRAGSGAGHYTLGPYGGVTTLEDDPVLNCGYGSSRPECPSAFGCNEQEAYALCCAPTPSCGNGIVDSIEEECDDANFDESDACLNSCSLRQPGC